MICATKLNASLVLIYTDHFMNGVMTLMMTLLSCRDKQKEGHDPVSEQLRKHVNICRFHFFPQYTVYKIIKKENIMHCKYLYLF